MIGKTALALVFMVAMGGAALAQAPAPATAPALAPPPAAAPALAPAPAAVNVVGIYTYNGTETDGGAYSEPGVVVVTPETSGAYLVKWDGGEYIGIGQVSGNLFAIAAVAEKKNTIMLLDIAADGSLSGKWWRRADAGAKGTETWKKK